MIGKYQNITLRPLSKHHQSFVWAYHLEPPSCHVVVEAPRVVGDGTDLMDCSLHLKRRTPEMCGGRPLGK